MLKEQEMNKLIQWAACAAMVTAFALPMTACGTQHVHKWEDWQRSETEHWRVCALCKEEERSAHSTTEGACTSCGYGFRAIGFGFTSGGDTAHADFAKEANTWFAEQGAKLGFTYTFGGTDFSAMTDENLANYELIILLNNKPGSAEQQGAFRRYMDNGGSCLIFHSAAFAMWDNGVAPSEWEDWYQNDLLGCGEYGKPADPNDPDSISYWNTWNPTAEPMKVETYDHFATRNLQTDENDEFMSAPCEWYEWHNDLFANPDFEVLLSLNPTEENPAGDDPREGMEFQIWKSGHHPIAWASKKYKMIYTNMGHNLQSYNDFEKKSSTFSSEVQNQFILDSMYGLMQKND